MHASAKLGAKGPAITFNWLHAIGCDTSGYVWPGLKGLYIVLLHFVKMFVSCVFNMLLLPYFVHEYDMTWKANIGIWETIKIGVPKHFTPKAGRTREYSPRLIFASIFTIGKFPSKKNSVNMGGWVFAEYFCFRSKYIRGKYPMCARRFKGPANQEKIL